MSSYTGLIHIFRNQHGVIELFLKNEVRNSETMLRVPKPISQLPPSYKYHIIAQAL